MASLPSSEAETPRELQVSTLTSDSEIESLVERSFTLANRAEPKSALYLAHDIMQQAPTSPKGFYAAGWIHEQYGQHKIALRYFNQARCRSSDLRERCQITIAILDSTIKLSRRIDFISRLPLELVSSLILPDTMPIPTHYAFSYMHVCKTWKERILQSCELHYTNYNRLTLFSMQLLVNYAPYIRHVCFRHFELLPFHYFGPTLFPRLEALEVWFSSDNATFFYRLIRVTGLRLKKIELFVPHNVQMNGIALNHVLDNCPNIESFTCSVVDVGNVISICGHIYTKVKTLSFESITQSLRQDDIVAFLKRFPSLECLVLPRCQSSRPLATIDQYCPLLRSLAYSMTEKASEASQTRRAAISLRPIKEPGFHSLVVDAEDNFDPQDVISLLTRHCATLIHVELMGKLNYYRNTTILDDGICFTNLNSFALYPDETDGGKEIAEWILQRSHNISKVDIIHCNIDDQRVYESMKQLTNLKTLSFALPSIPFIGILEYHGILGDQSTLDQVGIDVYSNGGYSTRVLKAVARLSKLRELFLQLRDATLGDDFVTFIEALGRGCPYLEGLIIESSTDLPAQIISKFPLYPSLSELTLYSPNIWSECLLTLLQCPQLCRLEIERENIPDHVAHALVDLTGEE